MGESFVSQVICWGCSQLSFPERSLGQCTTQHALAVYHNHCRCLQEYLSTYPGTKALTAHGANPLCTESRTCVHDHSKAVCGALHTMGGHSSCCLYTLRRKSYSPAFHGKNGRAKLKSSVTTRSVRIKQLIVCWDPSVVMPHGSRSLRIYAHVAVFLRDIESQK